VQEANVDLRSSFWNLLSFLVIVAGFIITGVFAYLFNNPYSVLNPFPPPTVVPLAMLPTLTSSPQALPDLWTETAEPPIVTETPIVEETEIPQEENTPAPGTGAFEIITPEPTLEESKSVPVQVELTPSLEAAGGSEDIPPELQDPEGSIVVTAPVGVFTSKWQNMQSIPSFSWKEPEVFTKIDRYKVYFSTRPDGKPAAEINNTHYSRPAVPSGEYYFRVEAVNAAGEVLDSSKFFVFQYDNTPPLQPAGFGTADPSTTYAPYFTWVASPDAHSGMEGGLAGYAIYQGTSPKCGKAVAFTTVPNWTPVAPLEAGKTEYFCVKAMDKVGNESPWSNAVKFTYNPS